MKLHGCRQLLLVCLAVFFVNASTPAVVSAQSPVFVRLTAPAAGATFTTGDRINIRWDAYNNSPLHHFHLAVSADGTQWTSLHDEIPPGDREFDWHNAGPASDTTRIRIEALDADNHVLAADEAGPFAIRSGPAGSLPWPWLSDDIGAVGAAGNGSFAAGRFTVRGSGADIWGTADAFHFVYLKRSGDFDVEAQVNGVENVDEWTKAGLMVRDDLGPSAAHASLFATPTTVKGLSLQTRNQTGDISVERRRISLAPPLWLKLMRRGTAVQAAYRRSTTASWVLLPFVGVVLRPDVEVGFAVSSHVDGTLASATFSDVRFVDIPTVIVRSPFPNQVLTAAEPFHVRWSLTAGEATQFSVRFSADSFTWRAIGECSYLSGDVRECTWRNPSPPTEQGLIQVQAIGSDGHPLDSSNSGQFSVRVAAGPPHVTVLQPRADQDIFAKQPYRIMWDAVDDKGIGRFDISLRKEPGTTFTAIPECTNVSGSRRECTWNIPDISGPHEIRIVATDTDGSQGDARSGVFHLETTTVSLPAPWTCGDIGAVGTPGVCRGIHGEDYEQIEVEGSGSDIWGTADEFTFARQDVDGDFSLTARVNSVENVNQWTKVGIMIRDWNGGSAGARHASLFVTPTTVKGVAFQRRPTTGGASVHTAGPAITAPVWLRLVRSGDVISAFYRRFTTFDDNPNQGWTLLGRQQFTGLPARLSAMLVSSSHVDGTLATGNFESIRVDPTEMMQSIDIGATAAGTTGSDGTTTTIEGDGADIWGTADAFRFHYARLNGDGSIIARVRSVENTNAWAKAGVMVRDTLTPASKYAMAIVSASKGISMQYRGVTGGSSAEAVRTMGAAPKWIYIKREGNRISTFTSTGEVSPNDDILAWEPLGEVTVDMGASIYIGLAVTSHSPGTLATVVFDDVIVKP